ncbi:MAG: hypothetical protein LBP33_06865 [Candidatus Adiutrix sp.]|jgi:hypothetical protein|nr:hypothetical protein [Candidatus Adiutrix sp.]
MRCPKCGYNSFDYHLICPKCRKDLTATRRLLNLTMPLPRPTDFFQTAGQRTSFPEPFLEATPDILAPPAVLQTLEPLAAAPLSNAEITVPAGATAYRQAGAPAYPGAYGSPAGAEIFPAAEEDDLEDISPVEDEPEDIEPVILEDDGPDDLQPVIQPSATGSDEEIEIEIDDLEAPDGETFADRPPAAGPEAAPHQAALDQIKSTLAQTGDLSPAPEAEGGPVSYILEDDLEPLEAPPLEEGEVVLDEAGPAPEEPDWLEPDDLARPDGAWPDLKPDEPDAALESYALNLDQNGPERSDEVRPETRESVALDRYPGLSPDQPPAAPPQAEAEPVFPDELDETPLAGLDTPLLEEADLAIFPEDPGPPPEIFPGVSEVEGFSRPLIPPTAVPEIPAVDLSSRAVPAADATLSAQLPRPGPLDNGDDLDGLVDGLDLDDLDDKL